MQTRDLKEVYRKAKMRLEQEKDPMKRDLYKKMALAIQFDLARRMRFKGKRRSIFSRVRDTLRIANVLSSAGDGMKRIGKRK